MEIPDDDDEEDGKGVVMHVTSSLLGIHVREGEQVATVSPTRTRWVSQE